MANALTQGIAVALAVIGCWAALFLHALFFMTMPWSAPPGARAASWPHITAVFFSLEFLYTGLFITTHDAMHGTIALRNRRLNGTYLPHRPPKGHRGPMPWHASRTSAAPRLLSFLTCYHFDLHWEHHRWPYAPWWHLPHCRELARRGGAGVAGVAVVEGLGGEEQGQGQAQGQGQERAQLLPACDCGGGGVVLAAAGVAAH
ncbi:Beta-carotene ketolase [Tetrabaena socialis]|uniref:Beta-carotene ketolase n=1 Tax=Tetrabaena socialis TaxID=47790 RepID=A0A2J7ZNP4_9CHLO|nr:Beta-carotene ketolase [Tetrabaena socialis]|eukprot:PNH01868.1 Beta-carotene ketolase [Tetrabaena socialis]